jgi:hypothetical protein
MGLDVYTSVVVILGRKTMEKVNSKNTSLVVKALNKLQKAEMSCKRSGEKTGIEKVGSYT